MSRGFAHYFFICCTELTQLCSFFGLPFLCMLCRIKEDCALKTITSTYYKNYNFLYSNTTVTVTYMYIKHYLSEPCVRCPFTHLYLSSTCIQV